VKRFVIGMSLLTLGIAALDTSDWLIPSMSIKSITGLVNRRYYFIERLRKTINLLTRIKERTEQVNSLINKIVKRNIPIFKHERIQYSMNEIIKTRSLKPLFMVWDDFTSYRSIEDELFVEEFTKEIFIITKGIFNDQAIKSHELSAFSPEEILDRIDELFPDTLRSDLTDVQSHIESEQIYQRFYVIQRLFPALTLMHTIHRSKEISIIQYEEKFSDSYICYIIQKIAQQNSLEPLLMLWEDIQQYKHMNERFIKEASLLFFYTYKHFAHQLIPHRGSFDDVVLLYESINSLPIEEILTAIDTIHDILSDQVSEEDERPWGTLLKKHWWIHPVLVGGTLLIKIMQHYGIHETILSFLREQWYS